MFKIFEWIGSVIAIACLAQIASNPRQAIEDIGRGPMPNLSKFNRSLYRYK